MRRPAALRAVTGLLVVPALLLSTAACGSDDDKGSDSISSKGGLPAITAGAKFGEKPTLAKGEGAAPKELKIEVISAGTGATLKKGDHAQVNYYGQEWDESEPFDTSFGKGQLFPVNIGGGGVIEGWQKALDGQKIGSRLEVSIPPNLAYGDTARGEIKANATLVFVMDIVKGTSIPAAAKGVEVPQRDAALPKVGVNTDGKAPSVTFPKGGAAPKKLVSEYVIEGTGPAVTDKDDIVVKYDAFLWDGGQKFGGTYGNDMTETLSLANLQVKGLKDGPVGKKIGSRVLLVLPPDQAFGDQEQQGIPKNSTLVFVMDILAKV
ncbi:FKBP-type peptidyl-prolyl cis-trans isomerase [Streptomyces sp. NPDC020875]|uniref:FKBP-type peptidyl-prolyl cis-trans isomerase n=1 Tax=Streptomyces sp. NPDC020875 TaxID=3154898 RepID=UPI0033C475F6